MSNATLPVWALVVTPLGAAVLGALSGPVTEKLRSGGEARATSREIQMATMAELLKVMSQLEEAFHAATRAPEVDQQARRGFEVLKHKAEALRVRVADEWARNFVSITMGTMDATIMLHAQQVSPSELQPTKDSVNRQIEAMTERLGTVYRSLLPK